MYESKNFWLTGQSRLCRNRIVHVVILIGGAVGGAVHFCTLDYFRECSIDLDFEVVNFPPLLSPSVSNEDDLPIRDKTFSLTADLFERLFDDDGRLINEHKLRQLVFKGGIHSEIRKKAWLFLFEFYSFNSTERERQAVSLDYLSRYEALKDKWRTCFFETYPELLKPNYLSDSHHDVNSWPQSPGLKQQKICMDIQAKVFAGRKKVDIDNLKTSIRIIDKDVPRTDRDIDYFGGDNNPNMAVLRNILITYSAFHPEVGYAQGMNDIVGRFLSVLESEVEAYWCFVKYMGTMASDFMEEGMLRKICLVRDLLQELDPDLMKYLEYCEMGDLMVCHRWLLLGFKREFSHAESIKCFEILSSHHLELSSMEAERIRREQRNKDFEKQGGKCRTTDIQENPDYTFELFLCVALLMENREGIFKCTDPTDIFQTINSLAMKIQLDGILDEAESLFMKYCRKSVMDCFQVVE